VRTLSDLRRLGARAGCTLVRSHQVAGELVGEFMCPDVTDGRPMATAVLLQGLTDSDDADASFDRSVLLSIASAGSLAAVAAHAYIQSRVTFTPEEVETFQSPRATQTLGYGDCDDSERALVVLARAVGVPARLVFFLEEDGQPAHVTAQLWHGGAWEWAETTIAARFGEHPFDALERIGGKRPDLNGTPVILTDAPPAGTMGSMDQQVERVATPVTAQDLADALAAAWSSVLGTSPGSAIQVLVAQSAFETGAWKAVWNYNLGNVKYTSGTDFFTMTASEGSGASTTMVPSKWRSYPSLAEGASAWLTFMSNNYSTALAYAQQGDVTDFVSALKSSGYFTGDLGQYTAGVQAYYAQYSSLSPSAAAATVQQVVLGTITEPAAVAVVGGAAVVGLVLGWLL
jgi:hypothetical protein